MDAKIVFIDKGSGMKAVGVIPYGPGTTRSEEEAEKAAHALAKLMTEKDNTVKAEIRPGRAEVK